ncbi:MAG: Chromosomal replication initiator protein DnaA [Candidatus Yanofskybacteria bacterium GW2011_GWD1_39_16]|uniref:Chromosomal replication initiator protein DnaA n=1 Tax=Candidatus Yanofskybacteria bacterium GW2011_GWD1_39_16 TaxID=1619030 RepID=A0A837HQ41_9BACT|nr:MAG: Chromosomal replication initiator protein DnaA [Candidatus Yanofskybacteria bacterium GW2011_GWD1_39_16]
MTNEELWKAVLGEMELSLSRANFTTWFKNTVILSRDKTQVIVSVPNGFIKEWLENKFNKKILQSIRSLSPETREVKYTIGRPKVELAKQDLARIAFDPDLDEKAENSSASDVDKVTNLNKKYSFESFVVGSNNELAYSAAQGVVKNLGKLYNPLFLYGGVGLGKTHLLQAIGNREISDGKDKKVLYIPTERFTADMIDAIRNRSVEELKNWYSKLDLLIIDDVQFIAGREKTQEIVFSVFNELYGKNKQIVFSSDRPPKAIPTLEDRLRSRFEGGMIADIGLPDYETRLAILNNKCSEKGFSLEADVLAHIATHMQKNVRELEGALNRVVAFGQIYNKTPDIKEVKSILATYLSSPYRKTSPQTILKAVADFYSISANDLIKRSRKKEVVRPRQVAMFLLREETKLSFPEIGQKLGGRDHSTVIHACEKIRGEASTEDSLKQELILIKERVYNSFEK